jgi:glucose/arabinose dehydrogenase
MGNGNGRSKASYQFCPTICDVLEERNLLSTLTVPALERSGGVALVQKTGQGSALQSRGHSVHVRGAALRALSKQDQPLVVAPSVPNVLIRRGYSLKLLATGLNYPDSIIFGPKGKIWVSEAGLYSTQPPQIDQINRDGSWKPIFNANQLPPGTLEGPLTDITYHRGWIWMTHIQKRGDGLDVGAISKFRPENPLGTFTTVITNLPSFGGGAAGYTFKVLFDGRGRAYFSIGSVTNSGVVDAIGGDEGSGGTGAPPNGQLNQVFRDYSPVPIVLSGVFYTTQGPEGPAATSPFYPYGSGAKPVGTVVPVVSPSNPLNGIVAGGGTVYSFNPHAKNPTSTLQLVAWGFRQPYGLGFDPYHPSDLYVTNNGIDTGAGSRIINNDYDSLSRVRIGRKPQFFGWPDFFHDPQTGAALPVSDPVFAFNGTPVQPVFAPSYSSTLKVEPAVSMLGYHVGADQLDFSTSRQFGYVGDMFIAESGAIVPLTGAKEFTGYQVVRVNPRTGRTSEFITHISVDPKQLFDPTGLNKPVDVKFRGNQMFVVDFGAFEPGIGLQGPNTGKVWLVTRTRLGARA